MTRRSFIPPEIRRARRSGALFVINHSGGKDSQAMTAVLRRIVPSHQLVVVYAHLPEVVWPDTEAHIRATTRGLEYHRVEADKTFFDLVEARGMFPSPRYRQCTSDLKRGPIHKWLRRYCKAHGIHQVVQCLGMRAEESTDRARRKVLKLDKRLSKAGRSVYEWLPIHGFTTGEVFATIAGAGQRPHWAYAAGMTRLSCCFCIMAGRRDLTTAARLRPNLYRRYVALERKLRFTLQCGRRLEETTGIAVPGNARPARKPQLGRIHVSRIDQSATPRLGLLPVWWTPR